jgi:hypothetical protein
MKEELSARIELAELRISEDILRQPEVLPLFLRNLVVVMTDHLDLPKDRLVFKKYMKIVYDLECAFKL